jgi:iron uptake system component EfeO
MRNLSRLAPALGLALALPLSGCSTSSTDEDGGSGTVAVSSTDDKCTLSTTTAPAGPLTFEVTNDGSQVTEFYLLGQDGKQVLGEVEDIGPGLTRKLVVRVQPGTYVAACKPGMTGDGIRQDFTVTGKAGDAALPAKRQAQLDAASADYAAFVRTEADRLLRGTREFAAAVKSGRDDRARHLYPRVRTHWERIEPVAESFGDLDPKMDARQADLGPGQEWTGWHRLEKDLWPPAGSAHALTPAQRRACADRLLADTVTLHRRVQDLSFGADQIANGAKELLDEVATGKVTGEEEVWSHTDLFDFQANVDGARRAFTVLRPVLQEEEPALAREIDRRFSALQDRLDRYRDGDGFVSYDRLGTTQVRQLSDAVNALSEPLSRLTAAVVSA